MLALSDVIEFLLGLLRDDAKLAAFEADPDAALQDAGLASVTAQDVRDAQLVMADTGVADVDDDAPSGGGGGGGGGGGVATADPVTQITHVTRHYHATPETTIVQVDDRDTIINDSFNSDDDVDLTIIDAEGSFNSSVENDVVAIQDNDTVIEDNDVLSDDDTVVLEAEPAGAPVGAEQVAEEAEPDADEAEPEPEPVASVEAEQDVEPEPEPEPDPDPDPVDAPDADAVVI